MPRDNFENLDEEIMRVIFDLFDSDGGGTIGREEVPEMIRRCSSRCPARSRSTSSSRSSTTRATASSTEEFSNMMKMYVSPLDLTLPRSPSTSSA
ncbi:hypothetical protein JL721_2050 [Aureococcus anophagefferens]|nr:hypothetical protein JL721_2050 [Aureococcus anophagefferens]